MSGVKKSIKISGRGIHSGLPVNIVVRPYDKPGIFFQRVDVDNSAPIAATFDNVGETKMRNTTIGDVRGVHVQTIEHLMAVDTRNCTCLSNADKAVVSTIEHLMAALFMAGIDSALIEIDGPETPILDGSAAAFYNEFMRVGVNGGEMKKIVVRRLKFGAILMCFRVLNGGL